MESAMVQEQKEAGGKAAAAASSRLIQLSERINDWSEKLLFVLMLTMIFFTTIQVVFRVFFTAFSWTEEITCFLLFYATMVGTAVGFKRGSHIAVTFIVERLPRGAEKAIAVGVHLLGILFFAVILVYGYLLMVTESEQLSPGMQIPMAWIYVAFPLMGAVIILHLLAGIRKTFAKD
jgi:TRAP-type transport system small permease protein